MEGFFTKKETESKSRPDGKVNSCVSCGLYKDCKSPKMKPYGNFHKRILNIGEAPGEIEDLKGKQFQGKTGKLLQRTYKELGVDLFEDCLNINSVNCRPVDKEGKNRAPTPFEVDCCRREVLRIVEEYKPRLIIILGNSALYSLLGHRWKKDLGGITKWRGFVIPDQELGMWLAPVFHPSYIERSVNSYLGEQINAVEELIWKMDLKQAFSKLETRMYQTKKHLSHPFPIYKEPEIDYIEDLSVLDKITSSEVAFDYETTGLKPHAEGQRIVCVSIADREDHAYAFMMPKTRRERRPFVNLLINEKIGKIASNMKYEHTWSKIKLDVEVMSWVWDTMLYSHVEDNRPGITGLKFQVYVNFGVIDYSSNVDYYLTPVDKANGNAINRIDQLLTKPGGQEILLKYCALDSIFELRLANKQKNDLLPF